jgi:hypothetical protein
MDHTQHEHGHMMAEQEPTSYLPLLLVLLCIVAADAAWTLWSGDHTLFTAVRIFMGLFFVVFGLFKTLDWHGFADAFADYDIVAQRSKVYAWLYPAIEVAVGILLLSNRAVMIACIVDLIIMGIGSIGVLQAVRHKRKIRCACLGVMIQLPMTSITLIEDIGMGVLGVVMLLLTVR